MISAIPDSLNPSIPMEGRSPGRVICLRDVRLKNVEAGIPALADEAPLRSSSTMEVRLLIVLQSFVLRGPVTRRWVISDRLSVL